VRLLSVDRFEAQCASDDLKRSGDIRLPGRDSRAFKPT
jgi:hypothetical protein